MPKLLLLLRRFSTTLAQVRWLGEPVCSPERRRFWMQQPHLHLIAVYGPHTFGGFGSSHQCASTPARQCWSERARREPRFPSCSSARTHGCAVPDLFLGGIHMPGRRVAFDRAKHKRQPLNIMSSSPYRNHQTFCWRRLERRLAGGQNKADKASRTWGRLKVIVIEHHVTADSRDGNGERPWSLSSAHQRNSRK